VDVVLQDFDEAILVSARIELNDWKFRGHHELSDTFESCIHMRMARATECIATRQVSFTMTQTSRIHPSDRTTNWRAGCGRSACPVRREGEPLRGPSLPL